MLTYPKWSVEHLISVPAPRADAAGCDGLQAAWLRLRDREMLELRDGEQCPVRQILDEAAATVLGVSADTVAGWRHRRALEPTVSNRYARTTRQ